MHTLYLCASPIGNLEDVSLRLIRTLNEVSLIACEDTRTSATLLARYDIHTPLTAYHDHNKARETDRLIDYLLTEGDLALLTDAGMPAVSDPGYELACAAQDRQIPLTVIPGPSAVLTALVLAGLPTDRFVFDGFLPKGGKARRDRLKDWAREPRTIVFFEAPHRILATLADLADHFPDRQVAACRELTKRFEEVVKDTPQGLLDHFNENPPRGEFVLVMAGAPSQAPDPEAAVNLARSLTQEGMRTKEAAKIAAEKTGVSKRLVYQALIADDRQAD
ncbi:16S rRNA (cytidine(1402)-2'-O)-methyltransferase [Peptococcus simiae]|uniref:16S rRNA (cytidine(1402)-2'-O)-methyltransferase n=1 Tax=Peptococcus simiae TaxID=1643805 RepID=UPI003980FECC